MADTKLEMKQSIDEDNRKRYYENFSIYEMIDVIAESDSPKKRMLFIETFKNDILQFIIDNNIDLE